MRLRVRFLAAVPRKREFVPRNGRPAKANVTTPTLALRRDDEIGEGTVGAEGDTRHRGVVARFGSGSSGLAGGAARGDVGQRATGFVLSIQRSGCPGAVASAIMRAAMHCQQQAAVITQTSSSCRKSGFLARITGSLLAG
jgi:hypothetical protein